jgi:capsular polysaccharide transport system permease protein
MSDPTTSETPDPLPAPAPVEKLPERPAAGTAAVKPPEAVTASAAITHVKHPEPPPSAKPPPEAAPGKPASQATNPPHAKAPPKPVKPPRPEPKKPPTEVLPAGEVAAQAKQSPLSAITVAVPDVPLPKPAVVDFRQSAGPEANPLLSKQRWWIPVVSIGTPPLITLIYLLCFASYQWTAHAAVCLRSTIGNDSSGISLSAGVLSLGGGLNEDSKLLAAYLRGEDVALQADKAIGLKAHWQDRKHDFISRLWGDATAEDYWEWFQARTGIELAPEGSVMIVSARAYDPAYAQKLVQTLIDISEQAVNRFGQEMISRRLEAFQEEVKKAETEANANTKALLDFQTRHGLVDARGDVVTGVTMIAKLDGALGDARATLAAQRASLGEDNPEISRQRALIVDLEKQRALTVKQISDSGQASASNTLAAAQSELQFALERTVEKRVTAVRALEQARVEASHQLKHLLVVDPPNLPERESHPEVVYWTLTVGIASAMLYFVIGLIMATIREHRD